MCTIGCYAKNKFWSRAVFQAVKLFSVRRFMLALVSVLALSAVSAFAEMKVASLDVLRAISDSEEAKTLFTTVQQELQSDQDALAALQVEIASLRERLTKDSEILSDAERRRLVNDIESKQADLQFQANKLRKEFNDRQQEIISQIVPKLDAVLKDLVEIEGYDFILNKNQQTVLYVNTKHDITRKVTEKLNEKQ
ncbi:MAG: OmpH family outer membrane protein [Gammaproteobacteria bacterium]|nr:MAG: OmpH family outer membrane protein [Gammaproteobacteria bacterium]